MSRKFFARLMLALAADMVFLATFGGGMEALIFAGAVGVWAGLGGGEE